MHVMQIQINIISIETHYTNGIQQLILRTAQLLTPKLNLLHPYGVYEMSVNCESVVQLV